ncbi:hypothetical protein GCM10009735_32630 [Actinomadura chokoriensis]
MQSKPRPPGADGGICRQDADEGLSAHKGTVTAAAPGRDGRHHKSGAHDPVRVFDRDGRILRTIDAPTVTRNAWVVVSMGTGIALPDGPLSTLAVYRSHRRPCGTEMAHSGQRPLQ